jgi:multidrug resistance efflux pump
MLTNEKNYKRKAQRVDLPLLVQVGSQAFETRNWSLLGVAVADFSPELSRSESIEARLVLPLHEASFIIPVTLIVKNQRGRTTGCEFSNLSAKNKRILRRYIELSIDGHMDNVEDFIAAYSEPVIETPLQEALKLEEGEKKSLKQAFIRKSITFIVLGILLSGVIYYTGAYNLQYKIFTTGVITGSIIRVTANTSGILNKMYVRNHEEVAKDRVLFDIQPPQDVFEAIEPIPPKPISKTEQARPSDVPPPIQPDTNTGLVQELYRRTQFLEAEYQNAEDLFDQRLITRKDLNITKSNFLRARIEYERERDKAVRQQEAYQKELRTWQRQKTQRVSNPEIETPSVQKTVVPLHRRLAPVSGKIFRIEHQVGEYVNSDQAILLMTTKEKPFIVMKLHSRDILKLRINDKAHIYSEYDDGYRIGRVTQIGYMSVNIHASLSQETSLNESLVKLEFEDDEIYYPLNTRVEVRLQRDWFQRP